MASIKRRSRSIKRRGDSIDKMAKSVSCGIRRRGQKEKTRVEFLSSGSTHLNMALSQKAANGGWGRARVANAVGDGSSGKTICALELAFWCHKNIKKIKSKIFPKVKKVFIVYNNAEGPMDFPIEQMYGEDFVCAVEWVNIKSIEQTCRDFTRRMRALKKGEFLLYIIDSWDAIDAAEAHKRFDESIESDKEMKGSYETEKQKFASKFFSKVSGKMETNSVDATLFIVSQVRSKIGVTFGKKVYRAGGKALDFYTHQVAWIREIEKMGKKKLKEYRVYGIRSAVKIERNKVAKPFREGEMTILYDYGIDDLAGNIDYVYGPKAKTYKLGKKSFNRKDLFIKYIERNNYESKLVSMAEEKWAKVEAEFKKEVDKRKSRY